MLKLLKSLKSLWQAKAIIATAPKVSSIWVWAKIWWKYEKWLCFILIRLCLCHSYIKLASPRIWASTSLQRLTFFYAAINSEIFDPFRGNQHENQWDFHISEGSSGWWPKAVRHHVDNTQNFVHDIFFAASGGVHILLLVSIYPRLVSKTNHNFQRLPFQASRKLLLLWRKGRRWLHTLTFVWSRFELQTEKKIRKCFKVLVKILWANQVSLFFVRFPAVFFADLPQDETKQSHRLRFFGKAQLCLQHTEYS